ncbi:MAG: hypothetical protein WB341_04115 [Terracidiphilus sp.]
MPASIPAKAAATSPKTIYPELQTAAEGCGSPKWRFAFKSSRWLAHLTWSVPVQNWPNAALAEATACLGRPDLSLSPRLALGKPGASAATQRFETEASAASLLMLERGADPCQKGAEGFAHEEEAIHSGQIVDVLKHPRL